MGEDLEGLVGMYSGVLSIEGFRFVFLGVIEGF